MGAAANSLLLSKLPSKKPILCIHSTAAPLDSAPQATTTTDREFSSNINLVSPYYTHFDFSLSVRNRGLEKES